MINNNILDEIFPVPELNDLKDEKVQELKDEGFVITNFNSGGIFYTILMIILQIYIEFIKLFRTVLSQMFVKHATGTWMVLKAEDYSKDRKEATKTEGNITLRGTTGHSTITISAGTTFKTDKDINGDELRFFSINDVTFMEKIESITVPVEAEKEGSNYNVSPGRIVNCLKYLDGVESISNLDGWITKEGSDIEDIESLRSRTLNSWSDLATGTTAAKYKSAAETVEGVLYADVDQLHPRGQGSVDIIITSTAGAASDDLIQKVSDSIDSIRGEYDNTLVKSATTVTQNISITATLPALASDEGIASKITYAVDEYFRIGTSRNLNELILLDILCAIRDEVPILKNIKIMVPEDDVILDKGNVIMLGTLTINVTQEA